MMGYLSEVSRITAQNAAAKGGGPGARRNDQHG